MALFPYLLTDKIYRQTSAVDFLTNGLIYGRKKEGKRSDLKTKQKKNYSHPGALPVLRPV